MPPQTKPAWTARRRDSRKGRQAGKRPPHPPTLLRCRTGLASTQRWACGRPSNGSSPIVRSRVREHGPTGSWAPQVSRETCGPAALGSASVHHSTPARPPHMRLDANDASRQANVGAIQAPREQLPMPSGMTARRHSRSLRCAVRPASSPPKRADRTLRSRCPTHGRGTQGTGRPGRRSSTSKGFHDNAS